MVSSYSIISQKFASSSIVTWPREALTASRCRERCWPQHVLLESFTNVDVSRGFNLKFCWDFDSVRKNIKICCTTGPTVKAQTATNPIRHTYNPVYAESAVWRAPADHNSTFNHVRPPITFPITIRTSPAGCRSGGCDRFINPHNIRVVPLQSYRSIAVKVLLYDVASRDHNGMLLHL